jgi:glyoxylase-like metal-dependent hydrolase (beta-lactamase superfamily II)
LRDPIKLYAVTCGTVTGPFRGEEAGDIQLPVPCYLVDHPDGKALIDTGLHPSIRDDPHSRVGWVADILKLDLPEGHDVASRLGALGIDASELRYLVNTHLHFDHAGGNELIPETVELVVQRSEWAAGHDAQGIETNFYNPADFDQRRPLLEVEGEHDLFGDGSVICMPTPGHTPGHQSFRVRLDGGELVLCVDACYFADWMDSEQTPQYGFDKQLELESLRALRRLRDAGARMIYGHDPEQWATVPRAPMPIGQLQPA